MYARFEVTHCDAEGNPEGVYDTYMDSLMCVVSQVVAFYEEQPRSTITIDRQSAHYAEVTIKVPDRPNLIVAIQRVDTL